MKQIFDELSHAFAKKTTKRYSTSFSMGIKLLSKELQQPIYDVYGFVRLADEIVDSFHGFDKEYLLEDFKRQTWESIKMGISTNPILNAFQKTVNQFQIDHDLIKTFLKSMEMDLDFSKYTQEEYENYILGSAEVVGLMCLKIFVHGNNEEYLHLKPFAMKLGSAFQKINFLRDLKDDYNTLGRTYFPNIDMTCFDSGVKKQIEEDIEIDFKMGYEGILQLPKNSRFGVYLAYKYYYKLFNKIKHLPAEVILNERVRISNKRKYSLVVTGFMRHSLNML
jgi:phytoene/squalene synthetase